MSGKRCHALMQLFINDANPLDMFDKYLVDRHLNKDESKLKTNGFCSGSPNH